MDRRPYRTSFAELTLLQGDEFVEACYLAILNRSADVRGRTHYLRKLGSGCSKTDVILDLLRSKEAKALGHRLQSMWLLRLRHFFATTPSVRGFYHACRLVFRARVLLATVQALENGSRLQSHSDRHEQPGVSLDKFDALLNAAESSNRHQRELRRRIDELTRRCRDLESMVAGKSKK